MTHNTKKPDNHRSRPAQSPNRDPSGPSSRHRVVQIVKEGRDHFKSNRFGEAFSLFVEALSHEENNVFALVGAGDACRRLQKFKEAQTYYEKALQREPSNPFALVGLGDSHRGLNDHEQSIAVWSRYLAIQPDNVQVLTRIGDAYRRTGQFEKAAAAYSDALFHEPSNPYALRGRADSYRGLGQYNRAIESWDAYDLYHPGNAAILSRLGDSLLKEGNLDRAEEAYRKSIKSDIQHIYGYLGLGDMARHLKNPADAARHYAEALSIDPQSPRALTGLTAVLLEPTPPAVEDRWVIHVVRMALRENRSDEASAVVRNLPAERRKRIGETLAQK